MSCDVEKASAIFDKALAKGLITRKGAWYFYGSKNLGKGKEDATNVIMTDDEMVQQIETNLAGDSRTEIVVGTVREPTGDLNTLGVEKHTLVKTTITERDVQNQKVTEVVNRDHVEFLEQPVIDLTGAKILGVPKEDWHPYKFAVRRGGSWYKPGELMTTVPKTGRWANRRFMLEKGEWNQL